MNKKIVVRNGKKLYLLGKNAENKNVWLLEPSWDCGWYWGFGYLQIFTNNNNPEIARDIILHTHFDSLIINGKGCSYDNFKNYFVDTPLSDNEIWILCDYMMTFYTLKKSAELFRHGYSWQTERAKIGELQKTEYENYINHTILPTLFDKIDKLFRD